MLDNTKCLGARRSCHSLQSSRTTVVRRDTHRHFLLRARQGWVMSEMPTSLTICGQKTVVAQDDRRLTRRLQIANDRS